MGSLLDSQKPIFIRTNCQLFVVCPHDNCTNLATYDRCFTIAMNAGSIAYKPAMIGSGSSR